jgi:O-methyltransferase involved in polyketide biosynthesis
MSDDPTRISPTAHYTGYVWQVSGLSTPALATTEGWLFHEALRLPNAVLAALGGPTLPAMLVARHKAIDSILGAAVDSGAVTQVLEIASGYSPRGWRFTRRHGARLAYVEADLPHMVERKRRFLERVPAAERPTVVAINALTADGPLSLQQVARDFDRSAGLAIVTEGLTNYLDPDAARAMWSRFAALLQEFPRGLYVSDTRLARVALDSVVTRLFLPLLGTFVRGNIHLHFETEADARRTFTDCGFASFALHRPETMPGLDLGADPGVAQVQILDARTGAW